jgi:general L-amino acid transport system permease protein
VTIDAAAGVTRPHRPPPWNDTRIRGIFYQVLFVAVIAALGAFLIHNTLINLRRQHIASGFTFLDRDAAFGIGEWLLA